MALEFAFLEPWYAVLQSKLKTGTTCRVLGVSLEIPSFCALTHKINVNFPVDERSRSDTTQLQRLREAIELFTALSVVNNRAFAKFFSRNSGTGQRRSNNYYRAYPKWCLHLSETLPSNDVVTATSPVAWGTLLGFSDTCGYSLEFQVAWRKLEAMEIEDTALYKESDCFQIGWNGTFHDVQVDGAQYVNAPAENLTSILVGVRRLMSLRVPPVVQLCAISDAAKLTGKWQLQERPCFYLDVRVAGDSEIQEFLKAVTKTTTPQLNVKFDYCRLITPHMKRQIGVLLSTLLSGQSLIDPENGCIKGGPTASDEVDLSCLKVPDAVFAGTCSVLAELSSHIRISQLKVLSVTGKRWSWLTYALCCGGSQIVPTELSIDTCTLTEADLFDIKQVLQTNYPQPILEQGAMNSTQYGFVDIREGAKLQLDESLEPGSIIRVTSSERRCRAVYNPGDGLDCVHTVVPGYGVCKGWLGDLTHFTPDSKHPSFRKKMMCEYLNLSNVTIENVALLMDLLAHITHGLRCLYVSAVNVLQVDLSDLSAACPALQELHLKNFRVVVSDHNEVLQRWPIESLTIWGSISVSDLTSCLKDLSLRMAWELKTIELRSSEQQPLNEKDASELKAFDGEFLPVVKKKCTMKQKVALISVVTSMDTPKAARCLDAHILSCIFVFASTPTCRLVMW